MVAQVRRSAGRQSAAVRAKRRQYRRWVPVAAALLTFVIGVLDIATVLHPQFGTRVNVVREFMPGALKGAASAVVLFGGILLVMLSHALRRRKRRAWRAAVVLLAVSTALHLLHGLDVGEAALPAMLLAALVVFRREFYAVGDPRTRWRALGVFVFLVLFDLAVGTLGLSLIARRGDVVGHPSFTDRVEHVALGLVGVEGPVRFLHERGGDFAYVLLALLGFLTVAISVYLALRPAEPVARLGPADAEEMRRLLTAHGSRDSLGYFALRPDKSVVWSPSGKAAVPYRVVSGVMLASGDPLGDPEAWPGAMSAFLELAARHAWVPAVLGCGEQAGTVWVREGGLSALELGDEAVVDVGEFSLDGRPMRGVRQAVSRVERAGYTAEVHRLADLADAERESLAAEAARWRRSQTERGFSMALGRFADPADPDCLVVAARQDGELRGFLQLVPWGKDGLSLDVMRRDEAAENGVNEFLIARLLTYARANGVRRISLNFAVFRSALARGERLGAGPVIRAVRGVLLFLSRWFQIESLYRFNAKFRPDWEPRFLVYPSGRDLPRISIAALEAEAFLVRPQVPVRLPWRRTPSLTP